jgi:hypothetical protein
MRIKEMPGQVSTHFQAVFAKKGSPDRVSMAQYGRGKRT